VELRALRINTTIGVAASATRPGTGGHLFKAQGKIWGRRWLYGLGPSSTSTAHLGPSCLRTRGDVGTTFRSDHYLAPGSSTTWAVKPTIRERPSLRIGDYEDFKQASIDPYIALRDALLSVAATSSTTGGDGRAPAGTAADGLAA